MQIPTYNRQHYEAAGLAEVDWASVKELEWPSCAWCGSPPESLVRIIDSIFGGPFHLVQCRRCGLRFVWPRPAEKWITAQLPHTSQAIAAWIEKHKGEGTSEWSAVFYTRILDLLEVLAPSTLDTDWSLMDVGCGLGQFTKIAETRKPLCWNVQACDWNEAAIELASTSYPEADLTFTCASFLDFTQSRCEHDPDDQYDAVVMLDYLEHSYRPFADLQKACRLLRPAGLLVVKTFLDERDHEHKMLAPPIHLYHFTEDVLLRMIEDAGFTKPIVMHDGPGGVMVTVIAERL